MSAVAFNGGLPRVIGAVDRPALRIGLVTDVHYADRLPAGTRHYRDSMNKMKECVRRFNEADVDLAVELGDLIDAAETVEAEIAHLHEIEKVFREVRAPRHYVLGNHCVSTLTKEQFYSNSDARPGHYSFDHGGFHFVVLDACYRQDGVPYGNRNFEWTDTSISVHELEWLRSDLEQTALRTIVFGHQRLDIEGPHAVKNAPSVRNVLEKSEKVLAVFQGHNHVNDHREIGRIHYCSLAAVIEGAGAENNAYGVLEVHRDGTLKLEGFRKQSHYRLNSDLEKRL